jgi:maltose alpha-D-glucosyltransferase/alpha-amylase
VLRRGEHPLFLGVVQVEFEDGDRDHYFLPLAISGHADARGLENRAPHAILANITGARKGVLFDAWLDDHFARALLEALDGREQIRTKRGTVRALQTAAYAGARGGADDTARISRTSAEQSNTSIVYGDRLILKLFRRLEPGINPDFEIGRHLTEKTPFTRVPAVTGALEYVCPPEETATLAMMQQLVESQADGWSHATGEVARFFEETEGRGAPDEPLPATFEELLAQEAPPAVRAAGGGYFATAETLGRRTAEMHLALASDATDDDFAPAPFSRDDIARTTAAAMAQAHKALETLAAVVSDGGSTTTPGRALPADVAERARTLLASRDGLLHRIRSAESLELTASKIRIHGDYHLGQVLWVEEDFFILDFEGEPARSLAERRLKQSPLKDVAGMLRSFSYAAYAGLFSHMASHPADLDQKERWARVWQTWTSGAFLRAYVTAAAGALFIPADPAQREGLLRLFVLEKALYELDYELNNRPDWVRIPLSGIFDLL